MACESQVVSQWACGLMLCSGKPEIPSSQTQIRKVGKTPPSPTSHYKIVAVHVNWNKAVNLFMFVEKSVSSMNTNSDFQPASNQSSCKVHHCIVLCDQFHTNDLSLISLSQNTYFPHVYLESLTTLLTCVKEALAIDFTANMNYLQQPRTTSRGIHVFFSVPVVARWLLTGL